MRRWISEHPIAFQAAVFLVAWVGWIAISMGFGRPLGDAFLGSLSWVFFMGLFLYFTSRRTRKTASELDKRGQTLIYIRYPNSLPGSLSGIWNQGVATLSLGKIEFQPAVYDTLEPSGRATSFTVLDATHEYRPIARQDAKYIGVPGLRSITVTTDKTVIELAASPASLDKIHDLVIPRELHQETD